MVCNTASGSTVLKPLVRNARLPTISNPMPEAVKYSLVRSNRASVSRMNLLV